ncbi:hypothetical protein GX865_02145 [Candidatus Saccharibacteria bacterium]|nr:hypothetical protein [Candidatus Saccharibacteria bacterium]
MKKSKKEPQGRAKKVITNYIGGLGYYALLFGWALLFLLLFMEISKYVLHEGITFEALSKEASNGAKTSSTRLPLGAIISIILVAAVNILVIIFPYFLGKYMKNFFAWLVDSSGLSFTLGSLIKVKIITSALLSLITVIGIFSFNQDAIYNLPSYIIYGCVALSVLLFSIQHGLARLWKLSYDDIN